MFLARLIKSRYPLVRQYDQSDCGPAALLSVLKFWGGDSNLVHLRELTNTDAQGTNMLELVKAARYLGFRARGATGEYQDLMREVMPCIAHVVLEGTGLQHFVVIYRINPKRVLIGDPGDGRYWLSKVQFEKIWQEKAVILLSPDKTLFHCKPPNWMRWILTYFERESCWLIQSIFLGVLYTLLGLIIAVFVQWLIDYFIPKGNIRKIVITAIVLLILQMIRTSAGYLRQRFLVELNRKVNMNINSDFISHIFQLPLQFFDSRKKGDITARINDGIRIQQAILQIIGITIIDGMIITGSLIFVFFFSSILGLIIATVLPIYVSLMFFAAKRIKEQNNEVMKSYSQVESFYFDSLSGIDEILSHNTGRFFADLNRIIFRGFQDNTARLGLTQARISFHAEFAGGILTIGILGLGAVLVIKGSILLGEMIAVYSLLANMLPAANRLVDANLSLQGASIAIQRLMDLLLVSKEEDTGIHPFKLEEVLTIRNLTFSWPRGHKVFNGLNMSFPKGRITSIWGISGSGKSTLVKIIQRKYPILGGQILIDSTPIEEFQLMDYRTNIGLVPQNVKIFNGTMIDNILVGREDPDFNKTSKRIDELGFTAFLNRFPDGLLTLVGEEGRQLSSGEVQLLGLLRALLENPQILIIDEGISTIDLEMENWIFVALRKYATNNVVLVISHNLQTIRKSDYVYLLGDGTTKDSGTPEQLFHSNRQLQQLWEINNDLFVNKSGKRNFHVST